jgi:septum site-determining protein MinD
MGKCISVHSSRGGTGKTVLATNLAVLLAEKGHNVALLDLDFRSPSLTGVFSKVINPHLDAYLNSYLDGRCPVERATLELTGRFSLKGKLLAGFANPDIGAIRNIAEKSRSWEVSALKRLFTLLSYLYKIMNIDYCIYDSSPGVQYSSVNAAVSSDLSLIVSTLDSLDLMGTQRLLAELYGAFGNRTALLLNKIFPENKPFSNKEKKEEAIQISKTYQSPIIGTIPCYCKVLQADRSTILAIEEPQHPFIKDLKDVTEKIVAAV